MTRWLKGILIVLGILILGLGAFLVLFNWNAARGPVANFVSDRIGRELTINGDLSVRFSLPPTIRAEKVTLANADWGTEPNMLEVEVLEFRISLWNLIRGKVVLPAATLTRPTIIVEKNLDGELNWALGPKEEGGEPPRIEKLVIDQGVIVWRDPIDATEITVQVATQAAPADPAESLAFDAKGIFRGMPATVRGTGGPILSLRETEKPYPIRANAQIAETKVALDGAITGIATFSGINLKLDLSGPKLSQLNDILGLSLPETPPYKLRGTLLREGDVWSLVKFDGTVGDSDLAGDFRYTAGEPPSIYADLKSRVLDLDDLAGFVGAAPATGPGETASPEQKQKAAAREAKGRVLSEKKLPLDKLRKTQADVKLVAQAVRRSEALPLDHVTAHLVLKDGVLQLKPLNFGVAGGNVVSDIALDAHADPAQARAQTSFQQLRLSRLFPKLEQGKPSSEKKSSGILGGNARLEGKGNSIASLFGSANGQMALAIADGTVSNLLLELIGLDGAEIMKFLFGGDRAVTLRCFVGDFQAKNGLVTTALVLDTADTNVQGYGTLSFDKEAIELTLKPLPKDKSILSLRSPIHITGSFRDPDVRPDATGLALRGGAAVLAGLVVGPLAALIPLVETGPGEDSNCKKLVAEASKKAPDAPAPKAKRR